MGPSPLIWSDGRLLPAEALTIPATDRVFEHGLGLFETLRTWGGRPPLLDRHLARMSRSALALGIPLEPAQRPDGEAIASLLRANGQEDARLRLTLTGGDPATGRSVLWVQVQPLPPAAPPEGLRILQGDPLVRATRVVDLADPLAGHKTLNYASKRLALEAGRRDGNDEVLSLSADGRLWEGTYTNLFLVADGVLVTPPADGPILPGVMRALVLERASAIGLRALEAGLTPDDLSRADEVFLTNSVRGIVPVGRVGPRTLATPGPRTRRLMDTVQASR